MKTPGKRRRSLDTQRACPTWAATRGRRPQARTYGHKWGSAFDARAYRIQSCIVTTSPEPGAAQAASCRDGRAAAGRRPRDVRRDRVRRGQRRGHLPPRRVHPRRLLLQLPHQGRAVRGPVRAGDRPELRPRRGAAGRPRRRRRDPVAAAVERCLSTFRADRTWVLVHTEYALHAARHPEAAAALRRHAEQVHRRLTALIDAAAARARHRAHPPGPPPGPHRAGPARRRRHPRGARRARRGAADRAASDLERTALLLLLRSATAAQPPTDPPETRPPMSTFLARLGRASFRHRGLVSVAWLAILGAVVALLATLGGSFDDRFTIPGSESQDGPRPAGRALPRRRPAPARRSSSSRPRARRSPTPRYAARDRAGGRPTAGTVAAGGGGGQPVRQQGDQPRRAGRAGQRSSSTSGARSSRTAASTPSRRRRRRRRTPASRSPSAATPSARPA